MSRDFNNITLADIFRAKEERRRRLAKLPFEEKIQIVKRLQAISATMKGERTIFASFLKTQPEFAGEPIEDWDVVGDWYRKRALQPPLPPFDRRPDIICVTSSGRKIGVELKSWVNQDQITKARKHERIQENILNAIEPQPQNETNHIGYIWMTAKQVSFDKSDAATFRQQMFELIEEVDNRWTQKPDWDQEQSHKVDNLSSFPILEKYLSRVAFHPRPYFESHWITFPNRGGAYTPDDMLGTLAGALLAHRSDSRYKDIKTQVGIDESYLLVHYDFNSFAYNTPFAAPNFGFKDAADFARDDVLAGDGGVFDRIFLFNFLFGELEAYRIL